MAKDDAIQHLSELDGWSMDDNKLEKEFKFSDFFNAMKFVNTVAGIAEKEGHHPDIYIFYNKVKLTLSTHAVGGLSINDFILALFHAPRQK